MTTPSNPTPDSAPTNDTPDSWERVAGELRACKESQKQAWGDLDSSTLGRYLAGEVAGDELGLIERELADHPELRQLTDLVRDILGGLESAQPTHPTPEVAPAVLSFEKARKQRRVLPFLRRHAALAAAACLLVALGTVVPGGGILPSGESVMNMASLEPVAFLGDAVARATPTSPTTLFTTVEVPTSTDIALDNPLPTKDDRGWTREMKVAQKDNPPTVMNASRSPRYLAMQAHEKTIHAVADSKKTSSSDAATNHRLGLDQLRRGRVSDAEKSLVMTYNHCQDRLGPKHPYTTRAAQDLANLYAPALEGSSNIQPYAMNTPSPSGLLLPNSYPQVKGAETPQSARLSEQIAGQTLPQIQATVVPVLIRALETAPTTAERQKMVLALGNLGPVASAALPALKVSLQNATPDETRAILFTLGRIGPASVPLLNQLSGMNADKVAGKRDSSKDRTNLSARDQQLIRVTLRKLQSPEAQAGIADEAACLSFREIRTASMQLHRLAKGNDLGILVLIQTKAANRPNDTADRLAPLGTRGVHVVLDPAGGVEVKVSPALEAAGFSAAAVRDGMLVPCKAKQYDKACNTGVALILDQAAKLESARP